MGNGRAKWTVAFFNMCGTCVVKSRKTRVQRQEPELRFGEKCTGDHRHCCSGTGHVPQCSHSVAGRYTHFEHR